MKKALLYLMLVFALITPVEFANAGLLRNVVQSCAFGAGAMAAMTYAGLIPKLSTSLLAIPASEIIVANAIVGCGIGAAGATAATVVSWFYDAIL
jgi:hypothetical protein